MEYDEDDTIELKVIKQETQKMPVVKPVPDTFVPTLDNNPGYRMALLFASLPTLAGVTLLVTRHTNGFLFNSVVVALVLVAWAVAYRQWIFNAQSKYSVLMSLLALVALFMMGWCMVGITFDLPGIYEAPYVQVTPGKTPCPNHYKPRVYQHALTCVELIMPKGVH